MVRDELVEQVIELWDAMEDAGLSDWAESILLDNNASQDFTNPEEGLFEAMDDFDLHNAARQMEQVLAKTNPKSVQQKIYALQSGTLDVSNDYIDGFLDACSMIKEEYGIDLKDAY